GQASLLIWTTTPWTLVSNTAVAAHPSRSPPTGAGASVPAHFTASAHERTRGLSQHERAGVRMTPPSVTLCPVLPGEEPPVERQLKRKQIFRFCGGADTKPRNVFEDPGARDPPTGLPPLDTVPTRDPGLPEPV
ncbi:class I tRNA ligase family protein, partial [Streptomyces sp. CHA15]|nr:class I tRNA ligase family protein [Streptomyces sp. CHA15]